MSDILLQAPAAPGRLVLLFHGVGATPEGLAPLAARLAAAFPDAMVASVGGPDASDLGAGFQWFSVRGVTEETRSARVAATLPRFLQAVRDWQARAGVDASHTTLVGFSQGAIMALAAALAPEPPAARIVSLSGRFAELPQQVPAGVRFHFLHGDADPVIAASYASQAAQRLQAQATLDLFPGLGHGVTAALADRLVQRLQQ